MPKVYEQTLWIPQDFLHTNPDLHHGLLRTSHQNCAKRNSPATTDASDDELASLLRLNLLERRLVDSHTTVIIPFDDRVIFVRLLNCAEFSSRLSEVAQTLDAISGIQFLAGGKGLGERWLPGTV
jgi:hypothetical protein